MSVIINTSIANLSDFIDTIKKTIEECRNSQILISKELINRLFYENTRYIIWNETVTDSWYLNEGVEEALLFKINQRMAQIHYNEVNHEYVKLTFFATKGILYRNHINKR